VTLTIAPEKQIAEVEDLKAYVQLLALSLEAVSSKLQNLRNIVVVVNGRKQIFLTIGLIMQ